VTGRILESLPRGRVTALWPVLAALIITAGLFAAAGANPIEAYRLLIDGSIGSPGKFSDTTIVWVPLALAGASLVVTFAAGLWNIGVEGQIVMGAIGASWAAITFSGPGVLVMALGIVSGLVAGALWGGLAGVLKTRGGVHEIFGGLGLDFVAAGLAIYLIIGPWKRDGIASTSGTAPFREEIWFHTIGDTRLTPLAIALAVVGVVGVYILMRGTMFGLRLRAVGRGRDSAARLGVPIERHILAAFLVGGALAGVAGTVQALAFHHKLVPSISGGYGFLGILIVLLAAFRASWVAPIAFFFAAVGVGATQLELRLDLDSSVGGVFTALLVLLVVLAGGWQARRRRSGEA